MEDDDLPRRRDDILAALIKQALDPLSVDELGDRIEILEAEIGAHLDTVHAWLAASASFTTSLRSCTS